MVEELCATFEITEFSSQSEINVPSLCEIWNWQGDTSVLPYKVYKLIAYSFV
jgi:hypothetical protein